MEGEVEPIGKQLLEHDSPLPVARLAFAVRPGQEVVHLLIEPRRRADDLLRLKEIGELDDGADRRVHRGQLTTVYLNAASGRARPARLDRRGLERRIRIGRHRRWNARRRNRPRLLSRDALHVQGERLAISRPRAINRRAVLAEASVEGGRYRWQRDIDRGSLPRDRAGEGAGRLVDAVQHPVEGTPLRRDRDHLATRGLRRLQQPLPGARDVSGLGGQLQYRQDRRQQHDGETP
jgi:hypothetical protein